MTGNLGLDVFIGLVFIFLLYSLLATIVQELIARIFSLRARMLVQAVRIMLQDRDIDTDQDGSLPMFIKNYFRRLFISTGENLYRLICPLRNVPFAKAFFAHPTIKYLSRSALHSKPSYIDSRNFSDTLVRLLRGFSFDGAESQMEAIRRALFTEGKIEGRMTATGPDTGIAPQTLQQLRQLYIDAQGDINRFRAQLEAWFDQTMERANGWYKRQTQVILLVIGFATAVAFNVDAIAIGRILSTDEKAREGLVQLAISRQEGYGAMLDSVKPLKVTITTRQCTPNEDSCVTTTKDSSYVPASDSFLRSAYSSLSNDAAAAHDILGLGSPYRDSARRLRDAYRQALARIPADSLAARPELAAALQAQYRTDSAGWAAFSRSLPLLKASPRQEGGWTTLIGWLITALAISLGAPFWFDLLNRLIAIRSSGRQPDGNAKAAAPGTQAAPVSPKDIQG